MERQAGEEAEHNTREKVDRQAAVEARLITRQEEIERRARINALGLEPGPVHMSPCAVVSEALPLRGAAGVAPRSVSYSL